MKRYQPNLENLFSTVAITLALTIFPFPSHSQTTNPTLGGPQLEYDPTPKALEMTRYGRLPVNGNSGQITFEIPLYTYSDQDFSIPVSLSYASSGFMPGKQTGEVGLHRNCIPRMHHGPGRNHRT